MKLTLSSKPFVLQPDTLVGLRGAKNARVRVLRGRLWLTVEGMRQDFILEPGSAFLFSNNALALLEAKTECELLLEPRRKRLLFHGDGQGNGIRVENGCGLFSSKRGDG
ncbi:MAG TPA: DUF2917 domain-containing protein [Candidatus Competibacter sp.]|nr:hypothetical protein [Candidatus Competibacteraceae bacterium]HRC72861.1 DUF2917 domain-containing protein [Candidatus Competibacter sp.]